MSNPYLDLLPIVADRGWRVDKGYIRDRLGRCPLCALADEVHGDGLGYMGAYHAALQSAGFQPAVQADSIANAADRRWHPLRPALMAALGMKP
jgi:hypothetical protein